MSGLGISRRATIAGSKGAAKRNCSNNKSPKNKARGSSQIGGGVREQALANLREVDDDLDEDDRYSREQEDMMNDLNAQ